MWKESTINIGQVKEDSTTDILFQFISSCDIKVKSITASCGCTKATWDRDNKEVKAVLEAKKIPKHLKTNKQSFKKFIKIEYLCNDSLMKDALTIEGVVVKD